MSKPLTKAAQAAILAEGKAAGQPYHLTLAEAGERWAKSLQAENKSPRTIEAYSFAMREAKAVIGSHVPLTAIGAEHIDELLVSLRERGWKPASVSAVERPLRAFMSWCVARSYIPGTPFAGRKPVHVPKAIPQFPRPDEWARVVATTETRSRWAFRARRDRAILLLFGSVGARLAEVAGLKVGDIDFQERLVLLHGKGAKDRVVPLTPDAYEALRAYVLIERPINPWSSVSDALWLGPQGPMTPSGMAQMVRDRAAKVGVKLHPHALRHMAIHSMLSSGEMLEGDVMQISGHTTREMLSRYGAMLATERAHAAFLRMAERSSRSAATA